MGGGKFRRHAKWRKSLLQYEYYKFVTASHKNQILMMLTPNAQKKANFIRGQLGESRGVANIPTCKTVCRLQPAIKGKGQLLRRQVASVRLPRFMVHRQSGVNAGCVDLLGGPTPPLNPALNRGMSGRRPPCSCEPKSNLLADRSTLTLTVTLTLTTYASSKADIIIVHRIRCVQLLGGNREQIP